MCKEFYHFMSCLFTVLKAVFDTQNFEFYLFLSIYLSLFFLLPPMFLLSYSVSHLSNPVS